MKTLYSFVLAVAVLLPAISHAAVFTFDLQGQAGAGLLSGNETGTINGTPGSGDEFGAGITFDDVSKVLTINVAWGSGNGFTDLSGSATAAHVHGLTLSSGEAAFTETAGVLFGISGAPFTFDASATSGSITGSSAALNATNEAALFAGRLYINVHTTANSGGEIRGNLVNPTAVPEPSTYAMLAGFVAAAIVGVRRRARR